jgi:hypothetical protein
MAKSELVQKLDAVQADVHAFLRPLCFRKKGRAHNRRTPGGLTHVLDFQMGEYPIGERHVIPGFRESYYGKLAVNLGVFLPCVYAAERQQPPPDFIPEYKCTIRDRLGFLASGRDEWFELDDDPSALAKTIIGLLDKLGLPFFDQFKTYVDVLAYYRANGELPFQNGSRAALEAALVAHHLGDVGLCRSLLAEASRAEHLGFRQYVETLALQIGQPVG